MAAVMAMIVMAGCGKIEEISITSFDIVSFTPAGLRGVNGVVAIGVHNPTFGFKVMDIAGTIYHNGKEMADFTADDFEVNRKSDDTYKIPGSVTLSTGVSLFTVLGLVNDLDPSDYSMDITARVKAKGVSKDISRTGVPLSSMIK